MFGWLEFNVSFLHKYSYIRDEHRLMAFPKLTTGNYSLDPILSSFTNIPKRKNITNFMSAF